jgi:hypothetical protein
VWLLCVGGLVMGWGFVECPGVGGEDKGNGVSLGCSNCDFLTGIIPVGGIAGVVAPGLSCGAMGVCRDVDWLLGAWDGVGPWLVLIGMV